MNKKRPKQIINNATKQKLKKEVLNGVEPKYLISSLNELQLAMIYQVENEDNGIRTLHNCSYDLHRVIALLSEIS